ARNGAADILLDDLLRSVELVIDGAGTGACKAPQVGILLRQIELVCDRMRSDLVAEGQNGRVVRQRDRPIGLRIRDAVRLVTEVDEVRSDEVILSFPLLE